MKWGFLLSFFSPASPLTAIQRARKGTAEHVTYPYSWPEMEASALGQAGCWVSRGCWPWGCGSCLPAPGGSWRQPWARRSPSPREPGCPSLQTPWQAEGHCHQSFLHRSQTGTSTWAEQPQHQCCPRSCMFSNANAAVSPRAHCSTTTAHPDVQNCRTVPYTAQSRDWRLWYILQEEDPVIISEMLLGVSVPTCSLQQVLRVCG